MKRFLVIIILALTFIGDLSAINQDSVTLLQRDKAYRHYRQVRDTTTIRTWMNMDRMNKALIEVVEYDNKILKSYKNNDSVLRSDLQFTPDTAITQAPVEVDKLPGSKTETGRGFLLPTLIAGGILIIILIVLLITRSVSLKQLHRMLDESEETFNSKIKRMEFLESEVKKMKSREKEFKAELEKGIIDHQAKMQQLRQRIDELADENTRLEDLLAAQPEGDSSLEITSLVKPEAIKQELIGKIETMLSRLRDLNA